MALFIKHYEVINSPKYSYYVIFRIYTSIQQLHSSWKYCSNKDDTDSQQNLFLEACSYTNTENVILDNNLAIVVGPPVWRPQ